MKMSRRSFLKSSTAATAAAAVMGDGLVRNVIGAPIAGQPSSLNKWPGRIVINFNKSALTGTTAVQAATIKQMVDDAIMKLTAQTTVGAAWQSIFPTTATATTAALTATSKIAIKLPFGFASAPCGPHWAHVKGIIDGLNQMTVNGAKFTGAITVYDSSGGNNFNAFGYNATNLPGIPIVFESSFSAYTDGVGNRAYAATLHNADFLINVFSPRGHSDFVFTLGFKNHFGTYQNPSSTLHPGGIEAVNMGGPVYNKTVLNVCSAIYANKEKVGPGQGPTDYSVYVKTMDQNATTTNACTLEMSTDPVTAEMQGVKIMRVNYGGGFAITDMPAYLQNSANIGIIDPTKMDIRTIINGTTFVTSPLAGSRSSQMRVSASHVVGHNSTFIQYAVPERFMGRDVSFEIRDVRGSLLRRLSDRAMGSPSHISWDERDASNAPVGSGRYIVTLVAGGAHGTCELAIVK